MADLASLRSKYDPVVRLMHARGVQVKTIEMQGSKLLLRAEAPSADVKNAIWDEIKKVDPSYADLSADITVNAAAGAGQGGPAGKVSAPAGSYTVQKGDTLSHIAQKHYGKASKWHAIFDANRDQIDDPDKIFPGQVLKLPDADG